MNKSEFTVLVNKQLDLEESILNVKGDDYTQKNDDRLINFKRIAKELEMPVEKVWYVYFKKHMDAIIAFINNKTESEPIEKRIADARNYLLLLLGLIKENEIESYSEAKNYGAGEITSTPRPIDVEDLDLRI